MQKEVLLNAEEVFRLIGRQSWEIECLKAKVEELSQALRTAPKEPPTETAEKPEKEKSAIERNRDAREKAVMEAIEKALAERGETLEGWWKARGYHPVFLCVVSGLARTGRELPRSTINRDSPNRKCIRELEEYTGVKIYK